ncbi:MAG: hypothetical protein Q8J64_06640 [Thermodesulfovibrionales bacterium]|nr:hypothetical protein [Thermodesulfovibrionales bacterium]
MAQLKPYLLPDNPSLHTAIARILCVSHLGSAKERRAMDACIEHIYRHVEAGILKSGARKNSTGGI